MNSFSVSKLENESRNHQAIISNVSMKQKHDVKSNDYVQNWNIWILGTKKISLLRKFPQHSVEREKAVELINVVDTE